MEWAGLTSIKGKGIAYSEVLKGFSMNLEELFR